MSLPDKDRLPVFATRHDMIEQSFSVESGMARHRKEIVDLLDLGKSDAPADGHAGRRNKRKRFHQQRASCSPFASKSKIDKIVCCARPYCPDPTAELLSSFLSGDCSERKHKTRLDPALSFENRRLSIIEIPLHLACN